MLARRDLLVSDAERDAVAEFLQVHFTAGRLTHDELDARVHATYAARWRSELHALCRDLPPAEPPAPPRRSRTPRLVASAAVVLLLIGLLMLVAQLPDALQVVLAVLVVPMLVALAVVVVPFVLLIAGIRWAVDRLGGGPARRLAPPR